MVGLVRGSDERIDIFLTGSAHPMIASEYYYGFTTLIGLNRPFLLKKKPHSKNFFFFIYRILFTKYFYSLHLFELLSMRIIMYEVSVTSESKYVEHK